VPGVDQGLTFMVLLLTILISLVLRFRRSRGEERQQIKWCAYAGALIVSYLLVHISFQETLDAVKHHPQRHSLREPMDRHRRRHPPLPPLRYRYHQPHAGLRRFDSANQPGFLSRHNGLHLGYRYSLRAPKELHPASHGDASSAGSTPRQRYWKPSAQGLSMRRMLISSPTIWYR
jgi:hypothetical protein